MLSCRQVKEIVGRLREARQTLMFSATLPRSLADFAAAGLSSPQLVRLDADRKLSPDLALAFFTGEWLAWLSFEYLMSDIKPWVGRDLSASCHLTWGWPSSQVWPQGLAAQRMQGFSLVRG